jgi:biotin transport system permease protein
VPEATVLTYEPGPSPAHRLDPRSKIAFQVGFAVAAFAHWSPPALAGLTGVAAVSLAAARLSPLRVLRSFRFVLLLLAIAPVLAMVALHPPWLLPERALPSVVAGYQVVLVLFVAGAYVRSTPVRETRAAIQRHVPGRPGQLLGVGVGLVYRFFPLLTGDLRRTRRAIRARGGDHRPAHQRVKFLVIAGVRRVFERAARLSLALRARCLAWNPTPPALSFGRADAAVALAGLALALTPLLPMLG